MPWDIFMTVCVCEVRLSCVPWVSGRRASLVAASGQECRQMRRPPARTVVHYLLGRCCFGGGFDVGWGYTG